MQATRDDGDPADEDLELIRPEDFLPHEPFPADARRMGFDRYSGGEAAILAFASNLDAAKPSHRIFATLLLILVVGSFAATVWGQLH